MDTFTKRWDTKNGFTLEEAEKKVQAVNEAYGVKTPNSQWLPARIVPDPDKASGYMVVICQK